MLIPKIACFEHWEIPLFWGLLKKGVFRTPKIAKKGSKKGSKKFSHGPPKKVVGTITGKGVFGLFWGGVGGVAISRSPGRQNPAQSGAHRGGTRVYPPRGGGQSGKNGLSGPPPKIGFSPFWGIPGTPGALLGGIAAPLGATP